MKTLLAQHLRAPFVRYKFDPSDQKENSRNKQAPQRLVCKEKDSTCATPLYEVPNGKTADTNVSSELSMKQESSVPVSNHLPEHAPVPDDAGRLLVAPGRETIGDTFSLASTLPYLTFCKKISRTFSNVNVRNMYCEFANIYEFDYRFNEFLLITQEVQRRREFLRHLNLYKATDAYHNRCLEPDTHKEAAEQVESGATHMDAYSVVVLERNYSILGDLMSAPRTRSFSRPISSYFAINCLLYRDFPPAETLRTPFLASLQKRSLENIRQLAEKREIAASLKQKLLYLSTGNFKLGNLCRHEAPVIVKLFGPGLQKHAMVRSQFLGSASGKQGSSSANRYSSHPDFGLVSYTDELLNSLIYMYLHQFENVYTFEEARQKRIFLPPIFLTLLSEITRYELHIMSRLGVDPTLVLESSSGRNSVEELEISSTLYSIIDKSNLVDASSSDEVDYEYIFRSDSLTNSLSKADSRAPHSEKPNEVIGKMVESHPNFTAHHKELLYQAGLGLKLIELILRNNSYEGNLHFEQRIYEQVHIQYPTDLTTQPVSIQHGRLKNYQLDGVKFLISLYRSSSVNLQEMQSGASSSGCLLADDMGCGKTAQSIAFLAYLSDNRISTGMHLIISPLAVSDSWASEFQVWFPNFSVLLYKGDQEQRAKYRRHILTLSKGNISMLTDYGGPAVKEKEAHASSGPGGYTSESSKNKNQILSNINAIVTTYEYAIKDRSFFKQIDFDVLIVDEASRVKNARGKLIDVLKKSINCRFRVLLSGTPIQNNLRELFTLLGLIHPAVFCDYDRFESIFGQVFALNQGRTSGRHHSRHNHHLHHSQQSQRGRGSKRNGDADADSDLELDTDGKAAKSPGIFSVNTMDSAAVSDNKITTGITTTDRKSKRHTAAVTFADEIGALNEIDDMNSSYSYSDGDSGEDENGSEMSRTSSTVTDIMVPIESSTNLVGMRIANSLPDVLQAHDQLPPGDTIITMDNIAEIAMQLAEGLNKGTDLTNSQKTFIIERLHGILKPFLLRRVKTEVLAQLPPKEEIIIRVPLSAFQLFFYNLAIANGRALTNPELASSLPANFIRNLDIYLRCVCNHPFTALEHDKLQILYNFYLMKAKAFSARHKEENTDFYRQYGMSGAAREAEATSLNALENMYVNDQIWRVSGKLELLDNILAKLHKTSHRVLIFSQFKKVLDVLSNYLQYRQYKFVRFDGSVKDVDRSNMIRGYNKEDSKDFIFLLSTRAASHGLNLQTADTVIIFDCDYNGTYDQQAQDRCYRLGQVNPVKVFKLYSNTAIESKMLSVANSKLNLATIVMDAGIYTANGSEKSDASAASTIVVGSRRKTKMSTQEYILEVLSAKSAIPDDVHIPTPQEINKSLARSEMEYQTFQMYDLEMDIYWKKRNFDQNVPRLDPDVPSVFSEQKDQIYKEMREMNLLDDRQDVMMPDMQMSASATSPQKRKARSDQEPEINIPNTSTSTHSTSNDYSDSDASERFPPGKSGAEASRRSSSKAASKSQAPTRKGLRKIASGQNMTDSIFSRIALQVDKSLQNDAFYSSLIISSSIVQKTSVILTPVTDTVFASFLIANGTSPGVLLLVSTMSALADLLRKQGAYSMLGIQANNYMKSAIGKTLACFRNCDFTGSPEAIKALLNNLTATVSATDVSSTYSPGSSDYLAQHMFPESGGSDLQSMYPAYSASRAGEKPLLLLFRLAYVKAALALTSLRLQRDMFSYNILSYVTDNMSTQADVKGLAYSSLLFYFSSGIITQPERDTMKLPEALYGKIPTEDAELAILSADSHKDFTDVYVGLQDIPCIAKDVYNLQHAMLQQPDATQQPAEATTYVQYLQQVSASLAQEPAEQKAQLPIFIRITVNMQRLQYLHRHTQATGTTATTVSLIQASIAFHLRLMVIFDYLIHLIDPLCVHEEEAPTNAGSSADTDHSASVLAYRILSQFWHLPGKAELPSYYQVVPFPKPLEQVYLKLITLSYLSIYEFIVDMRQSFKNALQFNERSSAFCEHARACNELIFQQVSQHFQYCNIESVVSWFLAYERRLGVVKKGYTMQSSFVGCGIYELMKSASNAKDSTEKAVLPIAFDKPQSACLILSYGSGIDMAGICAYDVLRHAVMSFTKGDDKETHIKEGSARHIKL